MPNVFFVLLVYFVLLVRGIFCTPSLKGNNNLCVPLLVGRHLNSIN